MPYIFVDCRVDADSSRPARPAGLTSPAARQGGVGRSARLIDTPALGDLLAGFPTLVRLLRRRRLPWHAAARHRRSSEVLIDVDGPGLIADRRRQSGSRSEASIMGVARASQAPNICWGWALPLNGPT